MTPLALLSRLIAIPPVLDAVARDAHTPPGARLAQRLAASDPARQADHAPALPHLPRPTLAAPLTRDSVPVRAHAAVNTRTDKLAESDAHDAPAAATLSTTRLSQTAHLLSSLLAQAQPHAHAEAPVPATPLLPAPPHTSAELSQALRTALTRSGLFYESHLADWSLGLDQLDGLMQEPQNRVSVPARDPAGMLHPSRLDAPEASTASPCMAATAPAADTAMPPALHSLVSQQIQLLDTPTLLWRGDIWPGQPLAWALQHHPQDEAPADSHTETAQDAPVWTSRLKLTLPRLGELDLTLHWNQAGQLQIAIAATDPAAEHALQAARPTVHHRLTQAGCAVTAIQVSHGAA